MPTANVVAVATEATQSEGPGAGGGVVPTTYNIADVWEAVADRVPEREALVCGDRRCTYGELEERANRLANHLRAEGVGPGDFVGCYLTNRIEYLETLLACFKIRAVPVNINYRYVADELAHLFSDSGLVAVVCEPVVRRPTSPRSPRRCPRCTTRWSSARPARPSPPAAPRGQPVLRVRAGRGPGAPPGCARSR